MPIIKWTLERNPTQGYPSDGVLLKSDIETLSKQYAIYKKDKQESENDVRKLILGQACEALLEKVKAKLEEVVDSFTKWQPANKTILPPKVELLMGKLKKIERIMQKSVHYAVEPSTTSATGSSTLLLNRVCDVLRATIVVPTNSLFRDDFGSAMIDIVNDAFGGKVVSVKNRFMLSTCPELVTWDGKEIKIDMSSPLASDFSELANLNLLGRDSFYRDMAMLIKLEDKAYPNGKGLSHVYLELQIASEDLHNAKSPEDKTELSGHDAYRLLRAITEYMEYQRWTQNGKSTPSLPSAETFYAMPLLSDWVKFPKFLEFMWNLYRSHQKKTTPMWTAIDKSKWYAESSPSKT